MNKMSLKKKKTHFWISIIISLSFIFINTILVENIFGSFIILIILYAKYKKTIHIQKLKIISSIYLATSNIGYLFLSFISIVGLFITMMVMMMSIILLQKNLIKQNLLFLLPFSYYHLYPFEYNWFKEFF